MTDDLTNIIDSEARPWLPLPGEAGNAIKVLVADETRGQIIFMFRMGKGAKFPRHVHHCHTTAFTTAGEWNYDDARLPKGTLAYEAAGSDHAPWTESGAEQVVFLNTPDGKGLEIFLDDAGNRFHMDMAFFKQLATCRNADDLAKLDIPVIEA